MNPPPMKVASLLQPWASLVAIGAKQVETRSWDTAYRGTLFIHASKGWKAGQREAAIYTEPFARTLSLHGAWLDTARTRLPLGAIVAVCRLVDVYRTEEMDARIPVPNRLPHERAFGDYTPGRYAWQLHHVTRLSTPVPYVGTLGLRDLDPITARRALTLAPGFPWA